MFESLRQAFREAVHNFQTELNRDSVPEAADRLLRAMEKELGGARVELDRLAREVEQVRAEAAREEDEARTCLRREDMARRIGDEETARIAHEYATRHLKRKDLLEEKASVLARELADRRRETEEMTERLKEARLRRDALAATAGRTGAHSRLQEAEDLFGEMDRMADRIRDLEGHADAVREIDEMDLGGERGGVGGGGGSGGGAGSGGVRPDPDADVEARLAELKRRMGEG